MKITFSKLFIPSTLVLFMLLAYILSHIAEIPIFKLGITPRTTEGLLGVFFSTFIHKDFPHLLSNITSIFILSFALLYFYPTIGMKVFFLLYFTEPILVWLTARSSIHIGASGLVYSLASFLFFSGIFRKNSNLMALSLIIILFYGGIVWGIFPDFYPYKNISWESHYWGLISGLIYSIIFKKYDKIDEKCNEIDENYTIENINNQNNEKIIKFNYIYQSKNENNMEFNMNTIEWQDFEKIEIRVGTIISVEPFPEARKPAYKLKIDFGPFGIKNSSAQITHFYHPEDLKGKQIVAVINFPPKNIAGFMSECLVLGAYKDVNEVVLLFPERKVPNGSKIG